VYLVHGWGGSRRQFGGFVAPLLEAGFRVVAFDAPSHGESPPGRHGPRSSTALEFTAALRAVAEVHGPAHAVIAHSLGGLATAVALRDGLAAQRVVLLAPVASMLGFVARLREALGFGDRTVRHLLRRAHRRVGVSMQEFEAASMLADRTVPATLVIHDRDDRTVPYVDGVAIAAAWPGARLQLTTGVGHHRLLGDLTVVDEAVRFVRE
jgi:pimeloyl-ACP methyl ester carboxylesterase